jgi:hypothetical protein
MSEPTSSSDDSDELASRPNPRSRSRRHRLELHDVELINGYRDVSFHPGLNIIHGDITTGKTTMVRLLRGLLGTLPDRLAPEVRQLAALRGRVSTGERTWNIYRPRTSSDAALVEISEADLPVGREPSTRRVPVAGQESSYSNFLLEQLSIPAVVVPQARKKVTQGKRAVSMTDWLGYCIITGDELDSMVFGHKHPFRDQQRHWIFELIYGYYDPERLDLEARLRKVQISLQSLDQEAAVLERFLAGTAFADASALENQLAATQSKLLAVRSRRTNLSIESTKPPGLLELRRDLLDVRRRRAELSDRLARVDGQVKDLTDLAGQLRSQSAKLTRAIVADEWLVDFDFIVCPRCGNDVDPSHTDPQHCYLCGQPHHPSPNRDQMLAEQDRITSQIDETRTILEAREVTRQEWLHESRSLDSHISRLSSELHERTATFVSDQADQLANQAAEQAQLEAEAARLREYLTLLYRNQGKITARTKLLAEQADLAQQVHQLELSSVDADANVRALERRFLEYLKALHIPQFGESISASINKKTYLPEVAGRSFDELSSQGLQTLVNIAHALAHHTTAIDLNLPLPGLLVLDGISANSGSEGYDEARVRDVYELLLQVGKDYAGSLQIIAVDNQIPGRYLMGLAGTVTVMALSQEDRLIREAPQQQGDNTR